MGGEHRFQLGNEFGLVQRCAPGFDNAPSNSDTAVFANGGNGNTTISVDLDRTINDILFTGSAASYTLTGNPIWGSPGGEIEMAPSDTASQTLAKGVEISELGGTYTISNDSTGSAVMTVDTGISPGPTSSTMAPTTTLVLGGANTGANSVAGFYGGVETELSVEKVGAGSWTISGSGSGSGLGNTSILGGTLQITGSYYDNGYYGNIVVDTTSTLLLTGSGTLNDNQLNIESGGILTINNQSHAQSNRVYGFGMFGGSFNLIGGSSSVQENSNATVSLTLGANTISLSAPSAGVQFQAGSIVRSNGATLLVQGYNLGATPGVGVTNFTVESASSGSPEIGGGGAAGSTNINIDRVIVGQDLDQSGNAQYGFVTGAGQSNGLRLLNSTTEYTHTISDATDELNALHNVTLTSPATVNATTTEINSLRLDTGGSVGGGGTLTVNSGAILALPGNSGISVSNLSTGNNDAIFATEGNLNLSTNLTSAGFTKTGPGELFLSPTTQLNNSCAYLRQPGHLANRRQQPDSHQRRRQYFRWFPGPKRPQFKFRLSLRII